MGVYCFISFGDADSSVDRSVFVVVVKKRCVATYMSQWQIPDCVN